MIHIAPLARTRPTWLLLSIALAMLAPMPAAANGTLTAEYFVLPATHPDVEKGIDGKIVRGLVAPRLGPDHLPVVTAFGKTYAGPSGPIHDVNAAGELMWYATNGANGVRRVKIGPDRLPIDRYAFPPGKKGDGPGNGYLAMHWSGSFTVAKPQSVGLKLGSDDDSWVFVDGTLVVDNGGVKPDAQAPFTVAKLTAGTHRIDVFFADRHGTLGEITLSTAFDVTPPVQVRAVARSVPKAAAIAKQIRTTGHVAVYGIHFAFDKATITKDSDAVLAEVATVLRTDPSLRLRIEGHTDAAGDAAYNRDLSQRRADAVKAYLTGRFGIAASRLTTRGFGPDRPVASNATAEGRAKNRRVELVKI